MIYDKQVMIPINPHHKFLLLRALPYLWSVEMGPATHRDLRDLIQAIRVAVGDDSPDVKLLQERACCLK